LPQQNIRRNGKLETAIRHGEKLQTKLRETIRHGEQLQRNCEKQFATAKSPKQNCERQFAMANSSKQNCEKEFATANSHYKKWNDNSPRRIAITKKPQRGYAMPLLWGFHACLAHKSKSGRPEIGSGRPLNMFC